MSSVEQTGATCKTCPWWARNEDSKYPSGQSVPSVTEYGECRIYPPSQRWPRTHETDWCAEHPDRKPDAGGTQ